MKTRRHTFDHGVRPIVRFSIVGGGGGGYPIRRVRTCYDARKGVYNTVMILRFSVVVYEKIRQEKKNTTPNRRALAERANTGTRSSNIWQTRVRHSSCSSSSSHRKSRRLAFPAPAAERGPC